MKPTNELYQALEVAYQHFNKELFDDKLPNVLFTVQRQKGTLGYFVPDRWASLDGTYCHEIAINPAHMGSSRVIDVMQTLVHEMVHCWQYCYGAPGRPGYHNKEWAFKMIEIGLQPTTTGEPGGNIVGNYMSDYILEDGRFKQSCYGLIQRKEFHIPWIYRLSYQQPTPDTVDVINDHGGEPEDTDRAEDEPLFAMERLSEVISSDPDRYLFSTYSELLPKETFFTPPVRKQAKSKYQCPSCFLNVWAKPNVRLACLECDRELLPQ